MWITQARYPQAHSHNTKNMLSQLERRKPSGRESNQEIASRGPADRVHFRITGLQHTPTRIAVDMRTDLRSSRRAVFYSSPASAEGLRHTMNSMALYF